MFVCESDTVPDGSTTLSVTGVRNADVLVAGICTPAGSVNVITIDPALTPFSTRLIEMRGRPVEGNSRLNVTPETIGLTSSAIENDVAPFGIVVLPVPEPSMIPVPAVPVQRLSVTAADAVPGGTPIAIVHARPLGTSVQAR